MFWMVNILAQQILACQRAQKLESVSKLLKTLIFCRYRGPNHPTWSNLCKSVAQHSTSLGHSRLVLGFSQPWISVQMRTVEKQASHLLLYLLRKLTTIEVSYLYNTLGWSGGKKKSITQLFGFFFLFLTLMHKLSHWLIKQFIDKNPDLCRVKLQHANICIALDVDLNTDSISIFF